MLERPKLKDAAIVAHLKRSFGFAACRVDFLPYGNDPKSWAYKVTADTGVFFLKLRGGEFYPASALVPQYLNESGIKQVVAPLPAQSGELFGAVGNFTALLFPFIFGKSDDGARFTKGHWRELGSVLRRIHDTELPKHIRSAVRQELFLPWGFSVLQQLNARIAAGDFTDTYQAQFAALWNRQQEKIAHCQERAEYFAQRAKKRKFLQHLCHSDVQPANMRRTAKNELFLVDWDEPLFAPKERDLMFLSGRGKEERAFFEGYGKVEIDTVMLSYYRYEWVIQEFADCAGRIFLLEGLSDRTKHHAVQAFAKLFVKGNVVDAARRSYA